MDARPASDTPLPDMLGIAPPEHDVRGRILVLLIHGSGVGVFGFALIAPTSDAYRLREHIIIASLGALACASMAYLADGLRRFKCWSWFFVMGWLVTPLLVGLSFLTYADLSTPEAASTIVFVMMLSGAAHYLWTRRREFWTDAKLEALHPPPRAVSPQWRQARLAGIARQPDRVRRTVSPRPGALWMRRTPA